MNSLHIYTDGSRNPTLDTVGCGVYIPQLKYTKATRLNNEVSIFTAELFAILLAVEWVEEVKPLHTCNFSDCLSAIQAISKPFPQHKIVCDIRHTINNIRHQGNIVNFEWIPSHCGIHGNEIADQIAKSATHKNNIDHCIPLLDSEIKHILKEQIKEKWDKTIPKTNLANDMKYEASFSFSKWGMKRSQEVILHRLRLGTCKGLNNFLHKIGKHPNGLCETCICTDDVKHFLLNCRKYNSQRNILMKSLDISNNIQLTPQQLLGPKQNSYHIIKYVHNCNVNI